MTYRQSLNISWVLARELFWWSAVLGLPLFMAFLLLRQLELGVGGPQAVQTALISLWLVIVLFVILPQSIRDAVSRSYTNFRLSVVASKRRRRITYVESLQISLLALAMYVSLAVTFYVLHYSHLFTYLQLPFLVLAIFPATVYIAVRMPFRGFRLSLIAV